MNRGLNISTNTTNANTPAIIHIRENINIFPVSVIVVVAFNAGSRLSTLNANTGSDVIFMLVLKNHLYVGINKASELICISLPGPTNTGSVVNVFSYHRALLTLHSIFMF